ncbi:response regulator [Paenibacillus allorhizosphaerae]|uniref:Sensor histidine kinase RcsC n=1 Tax=Paenibacillus allorhizosphaerae TaxID=2849866 RepID=A0ABM8VA72_9BACL|nr:response regulator [Paenibacillus allorhizosphaerae]CAG7615506.1 Sensor histidine kinase RcsC [Paenibacillus allorhizosphaerae]
MYSILIVDDEKIEREGVKFLIAQYGLPLRVTEAENGAKALEYVQENAIDILLTDIKMPFMDGMQLAAEARKLDDDLQIIFFSAFSEFEYAKQAMHLKAANYLLKPIEVDEFSKVMNEVIGWCEKNRKEKEWNRVVLEGYSAGMKHAKEKRLLDLIHGSPPGQSLPVDSGTNEGWSAGHYSRMLLLDCKRKFFDRCALELTTVSQAVPDQPFDYMNLNEYQSLLFFKIKPGRDGTKEELKQLGARLQNRLKQQYGEDFHLIFSNVLTSEGSFHTEFNEMEKKAEYKFFMDTPFIMFTEDTGSGTHEETDTIEQRMERVAGQIENKQYTYAREGIGRLFEALEGSTSFSTVYVKYLCTQLVKQMVDHFGAYGRKTIQQAAMDIYQCRNLRELKDVLFVFLEEGVQIHNGAYGKPGRRDMKQILDMIHQEYGRDISLEEIADRVFLSPSYLSYLFKKETGVSLIKYLTQYRLEKAKQYLRDTNMKIVDVGSLVGYGNLSYFGALFKNYVGVTPAQYREELE